MSAEAFTLERIEKELRAAREAAVERNEGKVRVCSRRAAGAAIAGYLAHHPGNDWGSDALRQLQHLSDEASFPKEIRDAAARLTTRITDKFQYPFSTDPVADARLIADHFIRLMNADAHRGV